VFNIKTLEEKSMGWAKGMSLLGEAWEEIDPLLTSSGASHDDKVGICEKLIEVFESYDADDAECLYEIPAMLEALKNLHPEWDWEGYEEDIDEEEE
jgi:hypothetical protein